MSEAWGGRELLDSIGALIKERDEARAECAAMREAIEDILNAERDQEREPYERAEAAISGTAGRDLLERLAKLEAENAEYRDAAGTNRQALIARNAKLERVAEAARKMSRPEYGWSDVEAALRALDEVKPDNSRFAIRTLLDGDDEVKP